MVVNGTVEVLKVAYASGDVFLCRHFGILVIFATFCSHCEWGRCMRKVERGMRLDILIAVGINGAVIVGKFNSYHQAVGPDYKIMYAHVRPPHRHEGWVRRGPSSTQPNLGTHESLHIFLQREDFSTPKLLHQLSLSVALCSHASTLLKQSTLSAEKTDQVTKTHT